MTEKLTPYDPAEDLASDEAIAIFMAEAFQIHAGRDEGIGHRADRQGGSSVGVGLGLMAKTDPIAPSVFGRGRPRVFGQGGLDAYLVPGGVCAGGAGQGRTFGKEVCRFHRADFFSDGHHKKLVHGGVVFSGDALGGLLE